jgi:hypothetical protein
MVAAFESVTLAMVPVSKLPALFLALAIPSTEATTMASVASDLIVMILQKFLTLGPMAPSELGFFVTVFCAKDFDRVRRLYLALGTPFL